MNPFGDALGFTKMGVTASAKAKQQETKKNLGSLSDVADTGTSPTKAIAQKKAFPVGLGATNKIQNLANIPKMGVTAGPFKFDNLLGQQQGGLPNLGFTNLGMKAPTAESKQQFGERLDVANEGVRKEKEQVFNIIKNGGVLTQNDISGISKNMKPEQKQEFLSLLMETDVKIDGIDFNNEPKEGYTIGNTDISVNPIKQAGEKILQAKEYLKNNPQADPIMKTLLQGVINTLDQTGLLSMGGSANPVVNALESYLPKTDNPVTQGLMGFAGNTTRGVGQVIEGGAGLVDKGIAGTQSLVEGGPMEQYQTRQTGVGEDILDIGAGATQSLASIYAMPASLLIGAGIEALPPEGQKAVGETMIGLGDIIAKTPGLSQWMESLPPERRDEFKAELAGAAIGMLGGLKGKSNIVKNPKLFLQQNLNPVQLAKNFNENVIGIPSKALDTAVSTVGKMKMPDVELPSIKGDKLNKISEGLVASTFKQPAMREKYISKVGQTPEKTLLEAGIKGTLEEQTKQVLDLAKQSAKKARSEASKITDTINSPEGAWITDKLLEGVDTSIPGIQKKLQPILDMNERFKNGTATANDLIDAKTFLSRYEQIYDDFGRIKKTGDTFEKEALADMYSTMKTQLEDMGSKYGVDMEKINYDTMKFEGLRGLMTRAISREANKDIMGLSDYILGGYGATIDPVSTLLVVGGKKLLQSPNVSSRIASSLYKKKGDSFISRLKKNDPSIPRIADNNMAAKDIQSTVNPALPQRRAVDYAYSPKKTTPTDLGSNLDKQGRVIKQYTARDILEEVRAKKDKSNVSSKIDTIKAKDNQNIAVNKTEALKKELKGVQSDTLVSKSDGMGNKRYIDKIERTEKTKLPISESEMKRNNLIPIKNLKGENTGRYENKSLNQGDSNRTIYSKEGDIITFKKDDSYKIGYAIDNQIKSNYTIPKGDIITTDLYKNKTSIGDKLDSLKANKELQPLYNEAKKYKSAEEFVDKIGTSINEYDGEGIMANPTGKEKARLDFIKYATNKYPPKQGQGWMYSVRKIREEANRKQ